MRWLLICLYILVLAIPVVTWWQGADLSGDLTYELMRFGGLVTFTLMLLQLVVGGFMNQLRPIMGYKLLNFHIAQGIIAFILAWIHPAALVVLFGFQRVMGLTGFAAFGRMALLLLVISTAAGLLRSKPWLQKHWRWVHRLNYITFGLVYWHSWNLGMDTRLFPMVILYYLAPVMLIAAIVNKLVPYISKSLKPRPVDGE